MNQIIIDGNYVSTDGMKAIINGIEYPYLPNMKGLNNSIIDGKIYVDGYELKNGKWKRTLKALYYYLF